MVTPGADILTSLRAEGWASGDLLGLVVGPERGVGIATCRRTVAVPAGGEESVALLRRLEAELRPRWVLWSQETAVALRRVGGRLATAWDVAAVHRLLFGGWRADPPRVWAAAHGLDLRAIPTGAPPNLFTPTVADPGDDEDPIGPDGYLRPEWVAGGWSAGPARLARWAQVAVAVATAQQGALARLDDRPMAAVTARAESTAELLCAELSVDGLPMDRAAAEAILGGLVGPRQATAAEAAEARAARDAAVLRLLPPGLDVDLRSAAQVRFLLSRVGVEVPDTRAARLRAVRDRHPVVDALLAWRKAERIATTYGYGWLDEQVGPDGRLRGSWTGADGAAGRMTATAGLHNMPAEMRAAVIAEDGHVFVRADLGQIEPRVLAAVSGDRDLAEATGADDLYAPVAGQLGVDRATAKVAVLGAMYGQTTGHGAHALRRLQTAYPVAMAYLEDADRAARAGRDLRTYGGRLIPMGPADPLPPDRGAGGQGRGPRPLRAQRPGPGRRRRAVQDVGGHRAGPRRGARRPHRHVPPR